VRRASLRQAGKRVAFRGHSTVSRESLWVGWRAKRSVSVQLLRRSVSIRVPEGYDIEAGKEEDGPEDTS